MGSKISRVSQAFVTALVGGALVLGTAGAAGASAPAPALTATPGTPAIATQLSPEAQNRLAHFSCPHATNMLTWIEKMEAGIAAGLPKMHAAEAKAMADGKTRKGSQFRRMITLLGRTGEMARLQRMAVAIEAKCNVSAPVIVPKTARK